MIGNCTLNCLHFTVETSFAKMMSEMSKDQSALSDFETMFGLHLALMRQIDDLQRVAVDD